MRTAYTQVFIIFIMLCWALATFAQDKLLSGFSGGLNAALGVAQRVLKDSLSSEKTDHTLLLHLPSSDTLKMKLKADKSNTGILKKLVLPSDSMLKSAATSHLNLKLKSLDIKISDSKDKENERAGFNLMVENNLMYLSDGPLESGAGTMNVFSVAGKFSIAKLPVNLDLSSGYNSDNGFGPLQSNLFKFRFDKESLLQSLKSDADKVNDFKNSYLKGMELPEFTIKAITEKIRAMPEAHFLSGNPAFLSHLRDLKNVTGLLKMEQSELKEKIGMLISEQQKQVEHAKKEAVTQFQKVAGAVKAGTAGESVAERVKTFNVNGKGGDVQLRRRITDSISSVLIAIQTKLAENGLDANKIQLVQKVLSGTGDISALEKEMFNELSKHPKAGRFQSAFSKIREFQTGAFADQLPGSFLNRDLFVKGLNLSLNTRSGPVSLGIGRQNDAMALKDAHFQNSVYSSPRFFSYLSVPTNRSSFGSGKVSWVGSFSRQGEQAGFQSAAISRNSMNFTISQSLATAHAGKFTVDISKSASQYNNTLSPGSEHLMLDKSALSNYFSDELFETMAMGLSHDMESRRLNMTSNLYLNYAGVGFQNPGSAGGSNLKMQMGGNIKKKFFTNRLATSLRADLRNTPVSFSSDAEWKNMQVQFDSRLRLGRKMNLSLKYMENGMDRTGEVYTRVYSSKKIQVGGTGSYRIGGHYSFSNFSLAQQSVFNHQVGAGNSRFITLNYVQSVVFEKLSLTGSVFYNKETTAVKLIGDMLNGELGCQFSLWGMSMTSSTSYLDNKGVARQAGMKHNLQLLAGRHFDISAYADVRKNLIEPLYPDLYSSARGELSIKYYLKTRL